MEVCYLSGFDAKIRNYPKSEIILTNSSMGHRMLSPLTDGGMFAIPGRLRPRPLDYIRVDLYVRMF